MTSKEMIKEYRATQKLERAKLNYYLAGSKVYYGQKNDVSWKKFKKAQEEYKKALRKYGSLGEVSLELF